MKTGAVVLVSVLFAGVRLEAQTVSYVASVKRNRDAQPRGGSEYSPGGRFTATAITVQALFRLAYGVQSFLVVGAPGWVSSDRFDIIAKSDDVPAPPQAALLQALLKDRFQLEVRRETRQMPVFALVLAGKEQKLGPALVHSDFDCAAYLGGPHPPPEAGRTAPCSGRISRNAISARSISMDQLASNLAPIVQRLTLNHTGLAGGFDVELTWTPEPAAAAPPDPLRDDGPGGSIFSALQDQLGLKLVSERGPVEVLIIDRLQQPSEN